jgi:hypothetical protein
MRNKVLISEILVTVAILTLGALAMIYGDLR